MLVPDKYMNYKVSVVNIAASIINILLHNGTCYYIEVLNRIKESHGEDSKYEFQNALNFLYLLGKVDYYCENDILELII